MNTQSLLFCSLLFRRTEKVACDRRFRKSLPFILVLRARCNDPTPATVIALKSYRYNHRQTDKIFS